MHKMRVVLFRMESVRPRFLELHHKRHHVKGGNNSEDNLLTLCVKCHDDLHRKVPK